MKEKYAIQEQQYEFPYHYLPHFNKEGVGVKKRHLYWGFKYLCYLAHITKKITELQPKSVLDVGCGEGRLLNNLPDSIPNKVGVDTSKRAITFAQAFASSAHFQAIDAAKLDEQYDVVVAMEVLEHIPDEEVSGFLQVLATRTRNGGTVIISVPSVVQPLQEKHYRHYNASLFTQQLESSGASLQISNFTYVYRESVLVKLYNKIFDNRWWYLEISFLNKLIWRHIEKSCLYTSEAHGHDMVVTLTKK